MSHIEVKVTFKLAII